MRVLIVDDEPLVAMLLEDYLDALGHETAATAETVQMALAAADEVAFDVAILDCHLAGGTRSWPVAERLRERGIPFLFSSGGSPGDLPPALADRPMLAKPYSLTALQTALLEITE